LACRLSRKPSLPIALDCHQQPLRQHADRSRLQVPPRGGHAAGVEPVRHQGSQPTLANEDQERLKQIERIIVDRQIVSLPDRPARAFLDPELQAGKITAADAFRVLEQDVVLSHAFAQEEVERFTYRAPGQANSYFYGFTKLIDLREDTEKALGPKFNEKKFHDFILAQGLLPPDLMRKAVMEHFVPAQKASAKQ
jgi:hypothetical protein